MTNLRTTVDDPRKLEAHEAATIYPPMQTREFDALVASIEENGVQEKIVLCDGRVVDGKERLRAALAVGADLSEAFEVLADGADPFEFALRRNHLRRQLTKSQQATTAVLFALNSTDWQEVLLGVKERANKGRSKSMAGNQNARKEKTTKKAKHEVKRTPPVRTSELLARKFNVSAPYIELARKLYREAPDRFFMVHAGEAKLPNEAAELKKKAQVVEANEKPNSPAPAVLSKGPAWATELEDPTPLLQVMKLYRNFITDDANDERDEAFEAWMRAFEENKQVAELLEDIDADVAADIREVA